MIKELRFDINEEKTEQASENLIRQIYTIYQTYVAQTFSSNLTKQSGITLLLQSFKQQEEQAICDGGRQGLVCKQQLLKSPARDREKDLNFDANLDPKESKSVKTSTPMSTSSISAKRRSGVIVCVEASSRYSQGFTKRREECDV